MFFFKILEKFNKSFYKHHPYGQQTLIGTVDDLKNPSLTKMYEFFKTYYVANNMALVISGDFDTQTVMPMIEKKFGKWKKGKLPKAIKYKEDKFNGREFIQAKLSPIKLGALGFRTVANGNKDEIALSVFARLMSNQNQTGLLDKLSIDNKLMQSMYIPMQHNDYGAGIFLLIPKIIGQKLEDAEKLVLDEIEKIKKGEFSEKMVEAIKNEIYVDYETQMESPQQRAIKFATAFGQGQDAESVIQYPNRIKEIRKKDIIEVANKYFGDNFLAFYSKMGFPKKDKIEKPNYKPLKANTNAKSIYTKHFEEIPSTDIQPQFIDFKKDISHEKILNGVDIYCVNNPINNVFNLKIKYGVGNFKIKDLPYASQLLNVSGTTKMDVSEFKMAFGGTGCKYNIYSDDSYLTVEVEGLESGLQDALTLINELITNPKAKEDKIKILYEGEKANRKMEDTNPDGIASALRGYVIYGENSDFLNRLSLKQIKSLKADSLISSFKRATQYEAQIHFSGKTKDKQVYKIIDKSISFTKNPIKTESPIVKNKQQYTNNVVYFTHKKNASQSKVFFFANGEKYTRKNVPIINAFNMYFGGGFSGIVLQEVREYRSLAYSAAARYIMPNVKNKETDFFGFVGTQSDKTNDAINVFMDLIRDMPQKPERLDMIKDYLVQSAVTSKPFFRDLSEKVITWQNLGYKTDPSKINIPEYNDILFKDINKFYEKNVKSKPIVIMIVGDKKKVDLKSLSKYGKVIKIKERKLFN